MDLDLAGEVMSDPDIERAREIAIGSLRIIQALTRVGPDKAQDALQTIAAIIVTVQDGLDGSSSPEIVEAELQALVNFTEDAVHDKFDPSDD